MKILLVGCVSRKEPTARAARDLYNSELFRRRRAFAEKSGSQWLILSALYGLVHPDAVIEPYEATLKRASKKERLTWGARVVRQLEEQLGSLNGFVFEIHAGEEYVSALEPSLRDCGATVERPLKGLAIGYQLQWYDRHV